MGVVVLVVNVGIVVYSSILYGVWLPFDPT